MPSAWPATHSATSPLQKQTKQVSCMSKMHTRGGKWNVHILIEGCRVIVSCTTTTCRHTVMCHLQNLGYSYKCPTHPHSPPKPYAPPTPTRLHCCKVWVPHPSPLACTVAKYEPPHPPPFASTVAKYIYGALLSDVFTSNVSTYRTSVWYKGANCNHTGVCSGCRNKTEFCWQGGQLCFLARLRLFSTTWMCML